MEVIVLVVVVAVAIVVVVTFVVVGVAVAVALPVAVAVVVAVVVVVVAVVVVSAVVAAVAAAVVVVASVNECVPHNQLENRHGEQVKATQLHDTLQIVSEYGVVSRTVGVHTFHNAIAKHTLVRGRVRAGIQVGVGV